MGKIILLCGKICSGKSHYAAQLTQKSPGVILSCDEVMLDLNLDNLLQHVGDVHQTMTPKIKKYLSKKAVEIAAAGPNVILDFGFWSRQERQEMTQYFKQKGLVVEWHYIHISREDWVKNIADRNLHAESGYFVDQGLLNKLNTLFEEPLPQEMDVWVENKREK